MAKVTRKWLNENYDCISVSYCDLQSLLYCKSANYYTCGVYGWNFDAFILEGRNGRTICVTTGYRGMIDNCRNNYSGELGRKYNDAAREYLASTSDLYPDMKAKLQGFIDDFIDEVLS